MKIPLPNEEEEKELWRLYRFYFREARKCEKSKAFLAGCVMLGSALETILILMVIIYSDEIEKIGTFPKKKEKSLPKPLLDWTLAELLKEAQKANWLPNNLQPDQDWDERKAQIGDYAEVARIVRNLIHPSRYLKDHYKSRVTNKFLQRQFETVLTCGDWLLEHNNKALLMELKEHEKNEVN